MKIMRWGWRQYLELPLFHREVLIEILAAETKQAEKEATRRRRR